MTFFDSVGEGHSGKPKHPFTLPTKIYDQPNIQKYTPFILFCQKYSDIKKRSKSSIKLYISNVVFGKIKISTKVFHSRYPN